MNVSVVVPTLNSLEDVKACLNSLALQTQACNIILVANGTTDGTQEYIKNKYPEVTLLDFKDPMGFAGAVNAGIKHAISMGSEFVALLNNDAAADKNWLKNLMSTIQEYDAIGIATSKIKKSGSNTLDTTGDCYTSWLLPYPRGRGEIDRGQFDKNSGEVTAASGGASLYRIEMLKQIGLFDEDFFAYYEDVDISLRAQHHGWKVVYDPSAIVDHAIGGTSNKIKGFTTYQTMKNLPLLYIKNVPGRLLFKYIHGFNLAYLLFFTRSITRGHGIYALRGVAASLALLPKKMRERRAVLNDSKLSSSQFDALLVHDLPPNAKTLRKMRSVFGGNK